jgi:hypothetical protein
MRLTSKPIEWAVRRRKYAALLAIGAAGLILVVALLTRHGPPKGFAVVNGRPLPTIDLTQAVARAGEARTGKPFSEIVPQVADDLVNTELIYQRFRGDYPKGTPKSEVVLHVLRERVDRDITVSDEEIADYFASHLQGKTDLGIGHYRMYIQKQIELQKKKDRYLALARQLRADANIQVFPSQFPR